MHKVQNQLKGEQFHFYYRILQKYVERLQVGE